MTAGARVAADRGEELVAAERPEHDVAARADGGRARDVAEQRDLPDEPGRLLRP